MSDVLSGDDLDTILSLLEDEFYEDNEEFVSTVNSAVTEVGISIS